MTTYSDRICSPDETMARVVPLLSRYGISRLARLTDLDKIGIPVWNAIAPNSRSIVINQGKGIEDIDAKVSAAMEALERAVAGDPKLELRNASQRELLSEGFGAETLDTLILAGQREVHPEESLSWTIGFDILQKRPTWVPVNAVQLDDRSVNRFWQSSDGLASGNTLSEATFHGLLERIERDAEILSQFIPAEERRLNCVDPKSFRDPVVDSLTARVRAAGFRLQMFNITSNVGVPCIEAFIAPAVPAGGIMRYIEMTQGAGAHPNGVRAAIRAITEAAQSRLTYISGARDDILPETFVRPLPDHLFKLLSIGPTEVPPKFETIAGTTVDEMLSSIVDRLVAVGIKSVIVIDLNPGEQAFSVAKVIVPGLENPDGRRKRRLGPRALKRIMGAR
ncbi:YcaO-like family protein [Neorhizobium sp. P12A]|uniref:YcaO-like family protein n=1 Tax=Neorhizobium sp. P12A TaxID=2268027 RepID=UPI002484B1BA|nr:YcaO-like family protein [Neorhizobium sp. P12A]